MPSSRFSVTGVCVAFFDYALVVLMAGIGSLWWLAACLLFNPDPARHEGGFVSLILGWTALALVLVGRRLSRPAWRMLGWAAVLAAGVICLLWVRAFINELHFSGQAADGRYELIFQGGAFLLCLVSLFILRRDALKRGWLSATSRTVLAAGLAGYLVYLGWDEPVAPSVGRNQAVVMSGHFEDEATYLLTLRYTPAPGAAKVFTPPKRKLEFTQTTGEKRREYLLAHRADIQANWAELTEVGAWWAEMAAQPQLGDRMITTFDMPFIRFQPVRVYTQHALAIAALQALDGDGDGALAAIGEVYKVGARLEPGACTLVRAMIANVVKKQSLETAEFVLERARVSPEAGARFAALLAESAGSETRAKRLILTETPFWAASRVSILGKGIAPIPSGKCSEQIAARLNALLCSVVLNPQATSNRVNDYYERLALRAGARDLEGMEALDKGMNAEMLGGFQVKNISGRLFGQMGVGSFRGVAKTYWENEDRRSALVKRLSETQPAQ